MTACNLKFGKARLNKRKLEKCLPYRVIRILYIYIFYVFWLLALLGTARKFGEISNRLAEVINAANLLPILILIKVRRNIRKKNTREKNQ